MYGFEANKQFKVISNSIVILLKFNYTNSKYCHIVYTLDSNLIQRIEVYKLTTHLNVLEILNKLKI